MDLMVGIGKPLHSRTRMTLRTRFWELFSKGRHRGKLHYSIFFSPNRLAQLFLLKELNYYPLLIAK